MILTNLAQTRLDIAPSTGPDVPAFPPEKPGVEQEAARELLSLLTARWMASEAHPGAPSILSAAAWLTGVSLYQSLSDPAAAGPGAIVTTQDVDREWELLVRLLEKYNLRRADIPVGHVVLAAMAALPFLKPPAEHCSVRVELEEGYNSMMKKYRLAEHQGPGVAVALCSILIQQYSREGIISPEAATGVVAQGIFEAARACCRR